MTKREKELLKRIEELEARIAKLEAVPVKERVEYHYHYQPNYPVPQWPTYPLSPWCSTTVTVPSVWMGDLPISETVTISSHSEATGTSYVLGPDTAVRVKQDYSDHCKF